MDRTAAHEGDRDQREPHDQVVVLRGISWAQYEGLLRARGTARQPLMAYLDGDLELVTVSNRHEWVKKLVTRMVEAFAEETGISLNGYGNATQKAKAKKAGCEPDEWYSIGRQRTALDLAIEIVHAHGGIDKLEVYRRLGAAEVWFWIDGKLSLHRLVDRKYRDVTRSVALPKIDLAAIERAVLATDELHQTDAVRAYRRTLRRR